MRFVRTNIINPVSPNSAELSIDHLLVIDGSQIVSSMLFEDFKGAYEDFRDCIVVPGFIDLHVHLSQYKIRGLYHPALLPWLEKSVFPEEQKSRDRHFANVLSEEFFKAITIAGTTCSVVYTAPFVEAVEEAFAVAKQRELRTFIGMTLMDMNSPKELIQTTEYALSNSIKLHQQWHNRQQNYIFTPRFAPTCSEKLMRGIAEYARDSNAYIQTHLSENPDEIRWVQKIFNKPSYTDVYNDFGLLTTNTILAHAIHIDDRELEIIESSGASIAHCPDSNFYLKSGEFPIERINNYNIRYGLGSDVGAGTTLNMLYHSKLMNYRQHKHPVMPENLFYRITLGSAKVLGVEDKIGSLDEGKEADLVFLKPPQGFPIDENILSRLCFFGDEFAVQEVVVAGNTKYKVS